MTWHSPAVIIGSERFQSIRNKATELRLQPDHARAQLPELTATHFDQWAKEESFRLAKEQAYRNGQLRGSTDKDQGEVFPGDYIAAVNPLAERRIVLAGYRLADVLKQLFAQAGTSATPAGTIPASAVSGEIRGNRNSHIYHLRGCPGYESMSPANIVPFVTETEAIQAGYRKAKNCP